MSSFASTLSQQSLNLSLHSAKRRHDILNLTVSVVRLNSELSFIVLESVNNSTDYKHLRPYNISANCRSTVRKTSLARGPTLAYHVILLHNVTHYITPHTPRFFENVHRDICYSNVHWSSGLPLKSCYITVFSLSLFTSLALCGLIRPNFRNCRQAKLRKIHIKTHSRSAEIA